MTDLRDSIGQSIQSLSNKPLRDNAIEFLRTLGYASDRTLDLGSSKPESFLDLVKQSSRRNLEKPGDSGETWRQSIFSGV